MKEEHISQNDLIIVSIVFEFRLREGGKEMDGGRGKRR
jgi:hypothetical protein